MNANVPMRPTMPIAPSKSHFSRSLPSSPPIGRPLPEPPGPLLAVWPNMPKLQSFFDCASAPGGLESGGVFDEADAPDVAAGFGSISAPAALSLAAAELSFAAAVAPPGLKYFSNPLGGFSQNSCHFSNIASKLKRLPYFGELRNLAKSC